MGKVVQFDDSLERFRELLEERNRADAIYVRNEERIRETKSAYDSIKEFALESDADADVEIELLDDLCMRVCVTVLTQYLTVTDVPHFCLSIMDATNFDIVGHTDGKIEIGFAFDGCFTRMIPKTPEQRREEIKNKNR